MTDFTGGNSKDFLSGGKFESSSKPLSAPLTNEEVKIAAAKLLKTMEAKVGEKSEGPKYLGQGRDDLDKEIKTARDVLALMSAYVGGGGGGGGSSSADEVTYDNTTSGLTATQVQAAIDELDSAVDAFSDTDTHTAVSEDGTEVLANVDDINFTGDGVSVADDGDGSVTVTVTQNPDQNLFATFTGDTGSTTADSTTDTLNIVGIGGISTSVSGDTLTIDASGAGSPDQNLWATIVGDTGSTTADTTADTLTIAGINGIATSVSGDTLSIDGDAFTQAAANEDITGQWTFKEPGASSSAGLRVIADTAALYLETEDTFTGVDEAAWDFMAFNSELRFRAIADNGSQVNYGVAERVGTDVDNLEWTTNAFTLTNKAQFDLDTTAGNTRFLVYDVDTGSVVRVSVGAADSGGVGFKVLRIPN